MSKIYDEGELAEALAEYQDCRNYAEAARRLGIARSTLQHRVEVAARRNLNGIAANRPKEDETAPGFEVTKVSQYYDAEGAPTNMWLQTKPLRDLNAAMDAIHDAFKQYDGFFEPRTDIPATDGTLLTVYPIADLHLGMLSWRKETGEAYDIDIASNLLRSKMQELVAKAPASDVAVVLNLGDFFHADNNTAATPEHGNHVDVDSRHQKVLHRGVELMIDCIEMARVKHRRVIVRCLPGNHDPMSARALGDALFWAYRLCPEVEVDIDPGTFWVMQWGRTMLAAHHGHEVKPHEMPGVMASYWPKIWGDTEVHYGLQGHIHRKTKIPSDEKGGAIIETFQTIAAKDAWNRGMGHASGRSLTAIVYSVLGGEVDRKTAWVRAGDLK
jgi:hypothetical protein